MTNGSGGWGEQNVWLGNRLLAFEMDQSYFVHRNAEGSSTITTVYSGAPVFDDEFYPFGQPWVGSANTYEQYYAGFPRYDADLGLDPASFRDYNPRLGRWLSPDLLGGDITNPQSLNRYAYALNNPTTLTDPSGLDSCTIDGQPGICITSTDVGPGDPMLEMIWEMDSCLNPISGCPYDYYQQNGGSSSKGGGGGAPVITSPPSSTVTFRNQFVLTAGQVMSLVAANNESNLCDQVVDCIVFKESSTNGGFYTKAVPMHNGQLLSSSRGLMQVNRGGAAWVAGAYEGFPPAGSLYNQLFDPAINVQTGSALLQLHVDAVGGNLRQGLINYGTGASSYADQILNCVQQLQHGNIPGAISAAQRH